MKYKLILFLAILSVSLWLYSNTWHIKLDGTGDFTTIQQGINASANSDTVLVYPGTYYENINYNGNNITVASLELTTNDQQYISQTVIDGQRQGSCVSLVSGELDTILRGFTITNGQGNYHVSSNVAGGISIFGDYPDIIECDIVNCIITRNYSKSITAGINIWDGVVFLSGCSIRQNYAARIGGGIGIRYHSQVTFDPVNRCSIYDNFSGTGLDLFVETVNFSSQDVIVDTFTVSDPDLYFAQIFPGNWSLTYNFDILHSIIEPIDHDLYVSPNGNDNNSGLSPDNPLKTINLAVRNIASNPAEPNTIHLDEGVYSYADYEDNFRFGCKAYVNIIGADMNSTIIDGNNERTPFFMSGREYFNSNIKNITFRNGFNYCSLIELYYSDNIKFENIFIQDCTVSGIGAAISSSTAGGNIELRNITVDNTESQIGSNSGAWFNGTTYFKATNCTLSNNIITGGPCSSAGLYVDGDGDVIIENCKFINNSGPCPTYFGYASALFVNDHNGELGDVYINNNLFLDNHIVNGRGTIYVDSEANSSIHFSNNTVVDNISSYGVSFNGNMYLQNNILRNLGNYEVGLLYDTYPNFPSTLYSSYNNIEGGSYAIFSDNNSNLIYWEEGNIDAVPQFLQSGDDPYQLTEGSPCIDAGTPDTTGLFIPPWDLLYNQRIWDGDGNGDAVIDMGCYEYGSSYASGFIAGTVIDQSGAPLENAEISAGNYTTLSNEDGEYNLEVVVGSFDVICYLDGYEISINEDVNVNLGEITVINFILEPEVSIDDILNAEVIQLSNYPNPFNPSTTISFNVTQKAMSGSDGSAFATLEIFNIKGQKVKMLLNSQLSAGHYECIWNGKDSNNKRVSSGEYFAKLKIDGKEVEVQKMILLK